MSTVPYAQIADDDPVILLDLDGILTDAGFRCYEADDGDASKAMLRGHADKAANALKALAKPVSSRTSDGVEHSFGRMSA